MVDMYKTAQDVATASSNPAVEVRLNLAAFSIEAFKQTMYSGLPSLTDKELSDLVGSSYTMVLNYIMQTKDSPLVAFLFGSSRYLTALLSALSAEKGNIDPIVVSNLNRIIYDYFELGELDNVVEQLIYSIINIIDGASVTSLIVTGVSTEDASRLAVCFASANGNYNVAIARINKYLIFGYTERDTLNVQKIADIYLVFFSDKFTAAFVGVMIDSYPTSIEMTDEESEVYSMIGNAVLGILEYMPKESICNIVTKYSADFYGYYKAMNPALNQRFKLTSLSEDYPSVNEVVDFLIRRSVLVP